ncbi:alpha/beta hydrolase [Halomarina ordinaria]|uniref:Alpha/beta hydrolase n=1 Tax=Halomarina ordinaria TaxID=3033939 RepID=A0ABD5UCU4_9EURY|nr:dienelactone hydrolase family protein [Halomarina sp. PSRA2]
MSAPDDPHGSQRLASSGAPLPAAEAAVVLVHGRGATAESILDMAGEFHARGVAYLAPQAAGNTWYPYSFLAPTEQNQPKLDSALRAVGNAVETAVEAGIPHERVVVVGFSQGACLSSEFLARHARRYGGFAALSGGLVGPEGTPREYEGSFDGTPVFLGCSDTDPHIPLERVKETVRVFEAMDADVDERIYPGMGHGVNEDELDAVRELVEAVAPSE